VTGAFERITERRAIIPGACGTNPGLGTKWPFGGVEGRTMTFRRLLP